MLYLLDNEEFERFKKNGSYGLYGSANENYIPEYKLKDAEKENLKLTREINNLKLELEKYKESDPYKDRVDKYQNYIETLESINKEKNIKIEKLNSQIDELNNKYKELRTKFFENEEECNRKVYNAYDIMGRWKEKYEKLKSQKIRNYKKPQSITENEFGRGFDCYKGTEYHDLRDNEMIRKNRHYKGKENIILPIADNVHVDIVKDYIFNGENQMLNEIVMHNRKVGYCDIIGLRTNPYHEAWEVILGIIDKK
ncbi:MAG: hypothetical protein ACRC30_02510 [Clostridium sp.]